MSTDSRNLPELKMTAKRVKSFPLLGRTIDIRWVPTDIYGIAQALTNDSLIQSHIMELGWCLVGPSVTSSASTIRDIYCWLIKSGSPTKYFGIKLSDEWYLSEAIARRPLATPLTCQKPK
jgi:hypothetical protein